MFHNNNNGHFYGTWSLARSRAQCAIQKAAEKCINIYSGHVRLDPLIIVCVCCFVILFTVQYVISSAFSLKSILIARRAFCVLVLMSTTVNVIPRYCSFRFIKFYWLWFLVQFLFIVIALFQVIHLVMTSDQQESDLNNTVSTTLLCSYAMIYAWTCKMWVGFF